jgi:hypothetical protein
MKTYKLSFVNFDYIRDVIRENCSEDIEQRLLESSELSNQYVKITDEKFAKQLIMYINSALQGGSLKEEWKARHIAWMEMLTKIKKELLK